MVLLGLCLETFFPCTILSYPGQPPSSFQGILKMSFLEFQINRFLFSSCFSGNFLLAACILLTGGLFAKMSSFFDLLNLVFISKSTFYVVQSTYILPMIHAAWTRERSRVWELLGKKKLAVAGDGRCDSPGYSAKYGTYTMMDTASQLIIDFELVQVTQASSSVGMEKLGFQTLMHRLQTAKLNIATIITDRSPQVKALMKNAYANVNHQFDIIMAFCKKRVQENPQGQQEEGVPDSS